MDDQSANTKEETREAIPVEHAASSASDTRKGPNLSEEESVETDKNKKSLREIWRVREPSPSQGFGLQGFTFALENLKTEKLPGYVKQHQHALSFPEKLMLMLTYTERMAVKEGKRPDDEPVGWTINGTAFVIRDNDRLVSTGLRIFFGKTKFSSFTRKLYRWGFQKVIPTLPHGCSESHKKPRAGYIVFASDNFRKDNPHLLSNMCSITATKVRNDLAFTGWEHLGDPFPGGGQSSQLLPQFAQGSGSPTGHQQLATNLQLLLLQPPSQAVGDHQLTSAAASQCARTASFLNSAVRIAQLLPSGASLHNQRPTLREAPHRPDEAALNHYLEAVQAGLSFNQLGLAPPFQAQLSSLRALDQVRLQFVLGGPDHSGINTNRAVSSQQQQQQQPQQQGLSARERQAAVNLLLELAGLPRPPPQF